MRHMFGVTEEEVLATWSIAKLDHYLAEATELLKMRR